MRNLKTPARRDVTLDKHSLPAKYLDTSSVPFSAWKMVYCAVVGCSSSSSSGEAIAFFQFPRDKKLRRLWTAQISRKNFNPSQHVHPKVCERHFDRNAFNVNYDIAKQLGRKLLLKKDAVPTLHLGKKSKDEEGGGQRHRSSLAFQKRQNLQLQVGQVKLFWIE